jgi:DNA-binding response OmpR family regulator
LQRAILRVKSRISSTAQPDHWGDVVIDDARRILYVRGTAVPLPPKTFDVLSHLIQNEGRVVLQSELIALIAHTTADLRTRRVAYHIALLRRVLHENKVSGCIRTIRSRGYEWMRIT